MTEYKANGKVYTLIIVEDDDKESCCARCAFNSLDAECDRDPCRDGYFVEKKEEKIVSDTNKPHIHAEIIKAWADGATVEYFDTFDNEWMVTAAPSWSQDVKYRVKPEPNYPQTKLSKQSLENIYSDYSGDREESLYYLANQVIKHFITSGQMDEYIKERNK